MAYIYTTMGLRVGVLGEPRDIEEQPRNSFVILAPLSHLSHWKARWTAFTSRILCCRQLNAGQNRPLRPITVLGYVQSV